VLLSFPFHHARGTGFSISRRSKKAGAKGPRSTPPEIPRWPTIASSRSSLERQSERVGMHWTSPRGIIHGVSWSVEDAFR
jgi:hypothetical protein